MESSTLVAHGNDPRKMCLLHTEIRPGRAARWQTLPDTWALVLNKADQLCGIGEPGEIVIRTPFRTLVISTGRKNAAQVLFESLSR